MGSLKKTFRPEFLNRLDKIIVYRPLTIEVMRQIVDIELEELQERLSEQNVHIKYKSAVKNWLAKEGHEPEQGARGLKRLVQNSIENPLAKILLHTKKNKKLVVEATIADNKIALEKIN